ncbi:protein kinase [Anaeramoeba flamelloides]|uniref:Protein kinase n=1 Tax=Anaeramoeba flamelloides TaxID=1746091 RepID=A0AAV7YG70_9EUKA|nr:protein kinase [Anaeramoeba flamelloides]
MITNYSLSKTIGMGSFSKVKLGTHKILNKQVAIKIINKQAASKKNSAIMDNIRHEIEILKCLNHQNVLKLIKIFDDTQFSYIITEYVPGGELFDFIYKNKKLNEDVARNIFSQILTGVDYCHKIGIIHRDLKPENILLDKDRNVTIIDFGLSSFGKENNFYFTKTCGSPLYSSPELIKGKKYDGKKNDIWSMGVILFLMVCGYFPFNCRSIGNLKKKIQKGVQIPKYISSELSNLIQRMLKIDPKKRITIQEIKEHTWFHKNIY